jgi:hypothetical protein
MDNRINGLNAALISPEKAGVGGSIPSLATINLIHPKKSAALGVCNAERRGARSIHEGQSPSKESPQP